MKRLSYFFLRAVAELFRFVPFAVLHGLADAMTFALERVLGYRRAVLRENLQRAFSGISEKELQNITHGAYRNLADITLETLKAFTLPLAALNRRCTYENIGLVNSYLQRGQSVIICGAHINSWEWPCMNVPPLLRGDAVCVYKPLTNPFADRYINAKRAKGGMIMTAMDDIYGVMRRQQGRPTSYYFVSDQSPSSRKSAHWVEFLGRETAFMPGLDFLARRFRFPVIYFQIERRRRGVYHITFTELCTDPGSAAEQSITRAYAAAVEADIRRQPQNWLWTHKRWKFAPAGVAQRQD